MTTLRQKLIDEIQLRGFSHHTQDSYVRWVAGLAQFHHRSPDQIVDDEIKAYLLHLLRIRKLEGVPCVPLSWYGSSVGNIAAWAGGNWFSLVQSVGDLL